MSNPEITINIKGVEGSGKTKIWDILREALEKNGYSSTRLIPYGKQEERLYAWNDFHDIFLNTEKLEKEVCDV